MDWRCNLTADDLLCQLLCSQRFVRRGFVHLQRGGRKLRTGNCGGHSCCARFTLSYGEGEWDGVDGGMAWPVRKSNVQKYDKHILGWYQVFPCLLKTKQHQKIDFAAHTWELLFQNLRLKICLRKYLGQGVFILISSRTSVFPSHSDPPSSPQSCNPDAPNCPARNYKKLASIQPFASWDIYIYAQKSPCSPHYNVMSPNG